MGPPACDLDARPTISTPRQKQTQVKAPVLCKPLEFEAFRAA
jgi:hypothetical protein